MKLLDWFIPTPNNNYKAKLLRHEGMLMLVMTVMLLNYFLAQLPSSSASAEVDLNSIVYAHNRERSKYNLNPLSLSSSLIESATKKAEAMLDSDCWDHYCPIPPGVSPWKWFGDVNYLYESAGENLAEGFSDNETVMKAWMNSPTHRENVLKKNFEEIGIGFASGKYQNRQSNTIIVVHFGKPQRGTGSSNFVIAEENKTNLDNIQINYPTQSQTVRKSDLIVRGKADMIGDQVELILNNSYIYIATQDENGNFSFDLTNQIGVNEGSNSARITIDKDEQKFYQTSLTFSVDSVPPTINSESFELMDVVESDRLLVRFSMDLNDDTIESWIEIGGNRFKGEIIADTIVYNVDYSVFEGENQIRVVSFDEANNESTATIDTDSFVTQIASIIPVKPDQLGTSINIESGPVVEDIFSSWTNYQLPNLSSQQMVNLLLLGAIAILIVLDYTILKKYGFEELIVGGKHHFKLSLIFMVGFILLISGGMGSILTGSSI